MRLRSLDLAKGIMILLVITGHVVLGGATTLVHYIIYSFHMPVFIGLSGYLLNWGGLQSLSFAALARKYWHRMVIPWILAVIIYGITTGTWTVKPYFHLWFIPAYLSWILISRLLLRSGLTIGRIFIVSLLLSVSCSYLRYDPAFVQGPLLDTLLTTFRPDYYIFFVLGGFLRNYKRMPSIGLTLPLSVLLFIGDVLLFFYPNPFLSIILFFVFNGCLICLMLTLAERWKSSAHPFLEWVGFNSLGIYLWHVLPILFAFRYVAEGPVLFYSLAIVLEAAFFAFVFYTGRIEFVRKYFYGLESDTILGHRRSIT